LIRTERRIGAPMSMSKQSPRWRGIAIRVGLVLASTVIALLLAELLFRIVADKPQLRGGWFLGTSHRALDDDTIVIAPRLALPETYAHRPGVPVIVFLGDSFTEGYPLRGDDFRKVYVERIRTALGVAQVDVDVIAVGQGETGTDQQIRLFEKYVLPNVTPTIVVWELYTNDIHENLNYATFAIDERDQLVALSARDHWVHRRQAIYDGAPLPEAALRWSYLFTAILRAYETTPTIPARYHGDWERWSLDKIRLGVERVRALAATHRFTLHPIILTPGAVIEARTDPAWKDHNVYRWYGMIRAVLAVVPGFVDVELSPADVARAGGPIYLGPEDAAPPGDRHYTEHGHALLAEKLLPVLRADLAAPR
jgi:hypothetical protein